MLSWAELHIQRSNIPMYRSVPPTAVVTQVPLLAMATGWWRPRRLCPPGPLRPRRRPAPRCASLRVSDRPQQKPRRADGRPGGPQVGDRTSNWPRAGSTSAGTPSENTICAAQTTPAFSTARRRRTLDRKSDPPFTSPIAVGGGEYASAERSTTSFVSADRSVTVSLEAFVVTGTAAPPSRNEPSRTSASPSTRATSHTPDSCCCTTRVASPRTWRAPRSSREIVSCFGAVEAGTSAAARSRGTSSSGSWRRSHDALARMQRPRELLRMDTDSARRVGDGDQRLATGVDRPRRRRVKDRPPATREGRRHRSRPNIPSSNLDWHQPRRLLSSRPAWPISLRAKLSPPP